MDFNKRGGDRMTAAEEQIFYSVVTDIGIEKINE